MIKFSHGNISKIERIDEIQFITTCMNLSFSKKSGFFHNIPTHELILNSLNFDEKN